MEAPSPLELLFPFALCALVLQCVFERLNRAHRTRPEDVTAI